MTIRTWNMGLAGVLAAALAAPGAAEPAPKPAARVVVNGKGSLVIPPAAVKALRPTVGTTRLICVEFPPLTPPKTPLAHAGHDHGRPANPPVRLYVPKSRNGSILIPRTRVAFGWLPGGPGTAYLARSRKGDIVLSRTPAKAAAKL